jgi:hypothetical protein
MFTYKQRVHLIANSKRLVTMTGLRIMSSGNLNVTYYNSAFSRLFKSTIKLLNLSFHLWLVNFMDVNNLLNDK